MNLPSYREDEFNFARKKLERKIDEYKKRNSAQSSLPINYSDVPEKTALSDANTRMLYDLKKAEKYGEIAKIALEYFKAGDEKNGERYLATLYANSPENFEKVARELHHLGTSYPVFEIKEPVIKA